MCFCNFGFVFFLFFDLFLCVCVSQSSSLCGMRYLSFDVAAPVIAFHVYLFSLKISTFVQPSRPTI